MMIRGNFQDYFNDTMLPMIQAKVRDGYKQKPQKFQRIFRIDTMEGSILSFSQVSGMGLAAEIAEGGEVRIDDFVQGFKKQFAPHKFGLGFEVSQDLVEDDKFATIGDAAMELGRSIRETQEIDAASTFNNAFSDTGPDGVSLCNASHPLVKYGGVQSNILSVAADLDVTSLELALTDWRGLRRSNGHLQSLPTPRLLAAPANEWNANEILKGTWRSDTANRTINAFRYSEGGPIEDIIIWDYLTDPDAWFLIAPPEMTGLRWFWRRKPYPTKWFDERTERGGQALRYRKDHGYLDYMGVYGTPGA